MSLWMVAPKWNATRRFISLFPEANAAWLAVVQSVISVASAFIRTGDGGIGGYLAAVKELSEENIRLSRQILIELGRIEASLNQMPTVMRGVLKENEEYRLRERMQTVQDRFMEVEQHVQEGRALRSLQVDKLTFVIDTCEELAGKRVVPYGRGGVAAVCAPLAAAITARSLRLLRREKEIRRTLLIYFLPWLSEIMSTTANGALLPTMYQAKKDLDARTEGLLKNMPERLRPFLIDPLKAMLNDSPGQPLLSFSAACVSYKRFVAYGRAPCSFCASPPIYESGGTLVQVLDLRSVINAAAEDGGPGPVISLKKSWLSEGAPAAAPQCVDEKGGETAVDAQLKAIQSSEAAKRLDSEVDEVANSLATINDYRQTIYALYSLYRSVVDAERVLKKAAQ